MPCGGGCGGKNRLAKLTGNFEDLERNDRSMVLLEGDPYECSSYSGIFQGTHLYVAGRGTEHEKVFLRANRRDAIVYAKEHGVKIGNLVNVKSMCNETVLAVLGA